MLKSITGLVIATTLLIITPAIANDISSAFHEQDLAQDIKPQPKESYFATLAPMAGTASNYIGFNLNLGNISLKPSITHSTTQKNDDDRLFTYHVGLFGGRGRNFQNFYIGTELSTEYNFFSKDFSLGNGLNIKVQQPLNLALDLVPGYLFRSKDLLFYGRVGIALGLFKVKLSDDESNVSSAHNKCNFGFRIGNGIEYFFSKNFSMFMEYLYSRYGEFDRSFEELGQQYSYSFAAINSHQVKVGMAFNF